MRALDRERLATFSGQSRLVRCLRFLAGSAAHTSCPGDASRDGASVSRINRCEVDRLSQKRLSAALKRFAFGLRVAVGRDHDDRHVGRAALALGKSSRPLTGIGRYEVQFTARFCTASHMRSGRLLVRFGLTLIRRRIALSGILRRRRQCVHVDVAFVSQ